MVVLSRWLSALPKARIKWYTKEQICRGPDAVRDILPLTIVNIKKPERPPAPGFKKKYHSVLFGRSVRVRVTLKTQRLIEHAGGFDRYIYYTPKEEFKSTLALSLKLRMQELVAKYPHVEPPPLNKRNPLPVPKKLAKGLERVEKSRKISWFGLFKSWK